MKNFSAVVRIALAVVSLVCFGEASANIISGKLWHVPEATSTNAIVANVPATPPNVTFDVNSPLNFTNASGTTVQIFLSSGGAFNIVENTAGTLASVLDNGTLGTFIDFKGLVSVTNGQTFSVGHDDGLTLIIGGLTVISAPGPTAPTITTQTYNGPTGTFAFELVYGECCGGEAELFVNLPFVNAPTAPVPEPIILALFGIGLAGLTLTRAKKRRHHELK